MEYFKKKKSLRMMKHSAKDAYKIYSYSIENNVYLSKEQKEKLKKDLDNAKNTFEQDIKFASNMTADEIIYMFRKFVSSILKINDELDGYK